MNFTFSSKIAAAAAAGLIAAACGGSQAEPETPAGDAAGEKASCKGEEGCQHKGECKAEEGCKGEGAEEPAGDEMPEEPAEAEEEM